jgi:hypothetical protein
MSNSPIRSFQEKPILVKAAQFNNDAETYQIVRWINETQYTKGHWNPFCSWENNLLLVPTGTGTEVAHVSDWILVYEDGVFCIVTDSAFQQLYEPVKGEYP